MIRSRRLRVIERCVLAACLIGCLPGCALLDGTAPETPQATLRATPSAGSAPLDVSLDVQAAVPDGGSLAYSWEFGDASNPHEGLSPSVVHRYERAGSYTVRVTVTDARGRSATAEAAVTVENTPPRPSLRMSSDAPAVGEEVMLDGGGSLDPDGDLVEHCWSFGDGTTAEGAVVRHAYARAGIHVVRLTVIDNLGATATLAHEINVIEPSGGGCSGGGGISL